MGTIWVVLKHFLRGIKRSPKREKGGATQPNSATAYLPIPQGGDHVGFSEWGSRMSRRTAQGISFGATDKPLS